MYKKILGLGLSVLILAGCSTSSSYMSYTHQHYVPKDQYYSVNVYPQAQWPGLANPYYVIGKVSIEGFASNGVTPGTLTHRAQVIAQKKGADAIINAKTVDYRYYDGDVLLRFTGELIVYASSVPK